MITGAAFRRHFQVATAAGSSTDLRRGAVGHDTAGDHATL